MFSLFMHELKSRVGAMIGWAIGLTLFGSMYILIYPEVGDQFASLSDLSIYRAMGVNIGSFAGYMSSVVVQYVPIVLAIYAIIASTGTLAGEEDQGTLELIMATHLSRWQIVTAKALALAVTFAVILLLVAGGVALALSSISGQIEVDVTPQRMFLVVLNGWPITMAFTMMGLFLGAYLPNRRAAALVLTVVFVGSYFGQLMVNLVESLEGLAPLSLFYYFDTSTDIFTAGVAPEDVALLLGIALFFFVLALLSFRRRNVTAGLWPWQRARVPG